MTIPPEKILELAAKGGFDTELKIAAILSGNGWKPSQSVYYLDKDESVGRELDVYAYKGFNDTKEEPKLSCYLQLSIEAKKTSQPFIFFTSPANSFEGGKGFGMLRWCHNVGNTVLDYNQIESRKPLSKHERLGRSYMAFKGGGEQQIRSGLLSSLKGAIHYTETCDERYNDTSRDICFFLPMLIVEGDLFECFYEDGNDELTVQQVQSLVHLQNYASPKYGMLSQSIHVLTLQEFERTLPDYNLWGQSMLQALQKSRGKETKAGITRGGISSPINLDEV